MSTAKTLMAAGCKCKASQKPGEIRMSYLLEKKSLSKTLGTLIDMSMEFSWQQHLDSSPLCSSRMPF